MAAHVDIEYAVYTVRKWPMVQRPYWDKLCFALSLVDEVMEQAKITKWSTSRTFKGSEIVGTICAHPLCGQGYDHNVPILDAPYVTDEAGTGIVHIAAAHGEEDFELVKDYNETVAEDEQVEITDNVADDGTFRDSCAIIRRVKNY